MIDPSTVLRQGLLGLSRSGTIRRTIERAPVSRDVVRRFVAGETAPECAESAARLAQDGRRATVDFLGEDTTDVEQAGRTRDAYLQMLHLLAERGLSDAGAVEVSVKLSAVGQSLAQDGDAVALDNARRICEAAQAAGTTVTIDMEDHSTTDATLATVRELRQDFPWVGAVLQAYLHRTEADCRDLADAGSRIRLCKGAYREPASVAYQDKHDVDSSYVRCLKVLMAGDGYPMVASHDPRLIGIARSLADRNLRAADSFEFQMLYGIRPDEQRRITETGATMRVYLPYGDEWYGYLMRRMAERPANTAFFLRALATKD